MTKKLFIGFIRADYPDHIALAQGGIVAENEEEANGIGLRHAKERWPDANIRTSELVELDFQYVKEVYEANSK